MKTSSVKRVWGPSLGAHFAPVSQVFLRNYHRLGPEGLSSAEALFIIHLVSHKWDERAPYPSLGSIAKRMGMETRSVRKIAQRLESAGLVVRHRRSKGGTNTYEIGGLLRALETLLSREHEDGVATPMHEDMAQL